MSNIDLSTVSIVCEVENYDHVNEFLDLGWKLINTNNRFKDDRNYDTGKYEKVDYTCYVLGWFGVKGDAKYPANFLN